MALTRGLLSGTPDGTTTVFSIPVTLIAGSEQIFRNGLAQEVVGSSPATGQITISGSQVTFPAAPNAPKAGDRLMFFGDTP